MTQQAFRKTIFCKAVVHENVMYRGTNVFDNPEII